MRIKHLSSAVVILGLMTGCASTQKPTAKERIANVEQSFDNTLEQLNETQDAFSEFQGRLNELASSGAQTEGMRSEGEYRRVLSNLSNDVDEARLEISRIKTSTRSAQNTYQQQLRSAASRIERSAEERARQESEQQPAE